MKKSLFDFASSNPSPNFDTTLNQNPKKEQLKQEAQANLEETFQKYQNMPRDDLLKTLNSEIAKQKANGTFDLAKLQNTLNSLDPFLSPQQKNNIKELLKQFV